MAKRRSEEASGGTSAARHPGTHSYAVTMSHVARDSVAVPFLDVAAQHRGLRAAILEDVADLLDSAAFTNGPQVRAFEEAFAAYAGATHAVGLASGLDALRLPLLAQELAPGDEVVLPALTFVATAEAVSQAGGVPVLADVSETDYCLDVDAAAAAVSRRTRVLLPVHLYGQMADMEALAALADRSGLAVLEDACQAHGAARGALQAGTVGWAGAFSFYPGKNLGAIGDAGALVTDDGALAATVRALREHGQVAKYRHERIGWTARLDTVQAAVLLRKLPLLDGWNAERREAAGWYRELLAGVGDLRLPPDAAGAGHVWHLYVVRTGDPVGLGAWLASRGIGSGRHYPDPLHLTPAYAGLGHPEGRFPVAEAVARECLSLPLFPGITEAQVGAVAEAIEEWFAGSGR